MKEIKLTKGKVAKVDDADFDLLNERKWCVTGHVPYPVANMRWRGKQRPVGMHVFLMSPAVGMQVDHRDGDPLNNQRSNLRVCSLQENCYNKARHSDSLSPYKGVSWFKPHRKWRARIQRNGISIELGYFDDPLNAATAYDEAAMRLFGEFARLNFPEKMSPEKPLPDIEELDQAA